MGDAERDNIQGILLTMDVFTAALKVMMVGPGLGEHEQAGRRVVMITIITIIIMLKDYPHPQYLKAALRIGGTILLSQEPPRALLSELSWGWQ